MTATSLPWLFHHDTSHGQVVALTLDERLDAHFAALSPAEQACAANFHPRRRRTFLGGRLALRAALARCGAPPIADLLADDRGAPIVPPGFTASVSHKDDVALALVRVDATGRVGVDVEPAEPVGRDVSRYVLNDAERADLGVVLDDVRVETRLRFALKEALYKALDPFERRFIGFLEVEVWPTADGAATFTLHFVPSVGPVVVDGRWQVVEDLLVASVLVVKQGVK